MGAARTSIPVYCSPLCGSTRSRMYKPVETPEEVRRMANALGAKHNESLLEALRQAFWSGYTKGAAERVRKVRTGGVKPTSQAGRTSVLITWSCKTPGIDDPRTAAQHALRVAEQTLDGALVQVRRQGRTEIAFTGVVTPTGHVVPMAEATKSETGLDRFDEFLAQLEAGDAEGMD